MDGRLNKRLDKLVTIVINEHVTHAVCTYPADAHARVTRGAMVGAVTVLPLRVLPHYRTKLSMARARTMAPLVLSSTPHVVASVAKRQEAAAQLVASGAVTVPPARPPHHHEAATRGFPSAPQVGSLNQSSFVGYTPKSRRPRNAYCPCVAFAWAVTSI
jgi:hypothetical protein